MAQLSGVMTADFSDFYFAIDKSVVKLKEMEGASAHTNESLGEFSGGVRQVDASLSAVGIRIGPQIRAIEELRSLAGKSVSDIGALGLAGAITSTGLAAAQATTAVIEFIKPWYDVHAVIAESTAALLGWGDVAAERARTKTDLLSRATQIAGKAITDLDQAYLIVKTNVAAVAESFNTGAARVEKWNMEIAAHRDVLPTITKELQNHTSTVAQLSQHYNISREAIEYYTRTLADSAKAQKAWADDARPRYEAIRKAQDELKEASGGWHQTLLTLAPTVTANTMAALAYGQSIDKVALALGITETQVAAVDRQMKLNLATMAATEPALGTLDQWIKVNVGDTKAWNTEWRFTSEVIDTQVIPSLDAVTAKAQTASATLAAVTGVSPGMDQKAPGASIPIDLGNISYGSMGFAKVFEEYTKKNTGGGALGGFIGGGPPKDFLTWALSMGLATRTPTVNNTFNIVDTESGIARRVGDTITSQVQRGSLVN